MYSTPVTPAMPRPFPTSQAEIAPTASDLTATTQAPTAKPKSDYATLVELVRAEGLFKPQPLYYTFKMVSTGLMFGVGVALFFIFDSIWMRLFSAFYMALVFAQVSYLGHDTGHLAIFTGRKKREQHMALGLVAGNLLLGMSISWWRDKHNAHHADPNVLDVDPDIAIPLVAFSEEQLIGKSKVELFIAQYQAFFFYPMLILAAFDLQISSMKFLWKNRVKYQGFEVLTLALHHILYYVGIPMAIGFWPGVGFILLHQAFFGVFIGSGFAPNHKGMPMLRPGEQIDFLRKQVITARSVRGGPLVDFLYGGLNFQAVHHCFTNMPRNNLAKAGAITRRFCEERGIPYYETSVFQSVREIMSCLNSVGKVARDMRQSSGA
jgi:fatty acid desaturase